MERKRKINLRFMIINRIHLSFSFSFYFVFFVFLCCTCTVLLGSPCLDTSRSSPTSAKAHGDFQLTFRAEILSLGPRHRAFRACGERSGGGVRILGGPGSAPPRCTSKCGSCRPCRPVHVPVPPGTPVTAEYYPEAWRCKCGNKLYMP